MTSTPSGLEFSRYQQLAQLTDHLPRFADEGVDPRLGPLLGLAGEVGTLMAGYKKHLRDGSAYELFEENVEEELGDILWYLANAAENWGLSLETIAEKNLQKTTDRWKNRNTKRRPRRKPEDHFDAGFPSNQRLPRTFDVTIRPVGDHQGPEPKIEVIWKGNVVADALGDNTYDDSGYRYHDAFHLANAAVLGWSPVARGKLFNCKREPGTMIDAVEDGGRAIVIEEGIAAFMFAYGSQHGDLVEVDHLDFHVLKAFRTFTKDLEVEARQLWEVEEAVFQGFDVWRQLRANDGGTVHGDLANREITYVGPVSSS